jgi:hypothetical protein
MELDAEEFGYFFNQYIPTDRTATHVDVDAQATWLVPRRLGPNFESFSHHWVSQF